ncbi:MAG: NAD(P)H-dependent oxidoreductase [Verrucomicrobiales bacterium]
MKIAIINSNLASGGKTGYIAGELESLFGAGGHEAVVFHAGDLSLPACDGRLCYKDENAIALTERLAGMDAIVLVSPIYNFDLNAAAKNLIELTGNSWKGKAVALVCTAGGDRSYLSPLGFMNSLSLDYRCLLSPRFVFAIRSDFREDNTLAEDSPVRTRLAHLAQELPILAEAARRIRTLSES